MTIRKLLTKGISGRTAFILLTLVVIIHIAITYMYFQKNHDALKAANRDAIIQKIINTIHLLQATPPTNREQAIDALEDPEVHTSFSESPQYDLQFTSISFWAISTALSDRYENFAISIQMDNTHWLNISASVYSHFFSAQLFLVTFEIIVFGAILFAAWSINRFTQPLKNFKRAAEVLGVDLHAKPLSIYGPNIVRETAKAMNTMQERIRDLVRDRTQMLAAISHDLRTPITRMKLRMQFVDNISLMEKFIEDLDEMESMIAQTLSFARSDSTTEERKLIDLNSLLTSICDEMQDMGHNVILNTKCHRVPLYARPIAIKRAVTNLINNAIKYAQDVNIKLRARQDHITISILDNGPGIPEKDIEKVFEPFYRSDPSRSRQTGGVGLGLAVTKDIITSHGGDIKLKNRQPHGLEAIVTFYT